MATVSDNVAEATEIDEGKERVDVEHEETDVKHEETAKVSFLHTVLPAGVLDEQFNKPNHVICNFVGTNKNHAKQPDSTRRLNVKYPHGLFKLRSAAADPLQVCRGTDDLPYIAHLKAGKLHSVGHSTSKPSLLVNRPMVTEALTSLATALDGELKATTTILIPSLAHNTTEQEWRDILAEIATFTTEVNRNAPRRVVLVEETVHFRQRLERIAQDDDDGLDAAKRHAHAYVDSLDLEGDEARAEYHRLVDALHDTIQDGGQQQHS